MLRLHEDRDRLSEALNFTERHDVFCPVVERIILHGLAGISGGQLPRLGQGGTVWAKVHANFSA